MKDFLNNQFVNAFCWIPFLMAFGAGLYFNISFEPNLTFIIIGFIISIALLVFNKTPKIIKACMLFLFGFCYASIFTYLLNTPQLRSRFFRGEIIASVKNIDYTADKTRIYLSTDATKLNDEYDGTAIIRLSTKQDVSNLDIGDTIKANIGIFKPSALYAPETFDYARWAYFNRLTGTGYLDSYDIISHQNINWINSLRNKLHNLSDSFLVDSLVLGYKKSVPENDNPIWTATGVGHVWSISGFHMTLVGGWLTILFYCIFRCMPVITKRIPAKFPATILAWFGLLFYLFLSGTDVATIRAFLMTTLLFLAFLFGRKVISVRNICIAFCILFFINPHFVMQAGFQLSFSAIFGLVWLWTEVKPRLPKNKILKIIYTATLTSLVATLFTAPFVIAHFYSMPIYSLIGNLILLPIFSFAIMPLVIVGTFTACFHIYGPLDLAEIFYDKTLHFAQIISDLPFSTLNFPHVPNIALTFIIIGFLCLVFIKPLKIKLINLYLFLFFCFIGIILTSIQPKPIFYATPDHELVAFLNEDKLEFNKSRASNHYFAFDTWKRLNNEPTETPNKRRKHNKGLYVYKTKNFNLAYMQKFTTLEKNISKLCKDEDIDYIVSYFKIYSKSCEHKILNGGLVIYDSGKIKYNNPNRLWHIGR